MKYRIQVRKYGEGLNHHRSNEYQVIETIYRKPWAEQIGNFNPFFVRYKGKRTLLFSDAGDLSDPFRRTEQYANSFFIEV